jgi:CheY-like chemotaxis protein
VEDDENDVMLMRLAWKSAGLRNPLQVVTDGEQAVQYLSGKGEYANRSKYPLPCLVLLDWKLLTMSGLDVLKWIRQQPAIQTLPVIILSSSNRPADLRAAYARRANSYLMKPPNTGSLVEMLTSLKDYWLNHTQLPPPSLPG